MRVFKCLQELLKGPMPEQAPVTLVLCRDVALTVIISSGKSITHVQTTTVVTDLSFAARGQ